MKFLAAAFASLALLSACATEQQAPDWEPQIRAANEALLNRGEVAKVPDFFAATYVAHGSDGSSAGRDAIAGFVTQLRSAFPDLRVEIQVLAAGGDHTTWMRTSRGTHQGELMGVPASGRSLVWQEMIVSRYEDGLIAEEWSVSNLGAHFPAP